MKPAVNQTLSVEGVTTLNSHLNVTQNASVLGDLTITQNLICNRDFEITTGTFNATNAQFKYLSRTAISANSYNIIPTDDIVGVTYTATEAVELILPDPTNTETQNKRFCVVDEGGNAGTNNITVSQNASENIIGNSSVVISGDYNRCKFLYQWHRLVHFIKKKYIIFKQNKNDFVCKQFKHIKRYTTYT
jgi:hypothetical protein